MFEVEYRYKDIRGNDLRLMVLPLPTKHLPSLWSIQKKFATIGLNQSEKALYKKVEEGKELTAEEQLVIVHKEQSIMDSLGEEDIKSLVGLCEAAVKKSAPHLKQEEVEEFLCNNFWDFYPVVLNVNLNKSK